MIAPILALPVVLIQAQTMEPPFALPVGSNYILATVVVGFLMSPVTSAINRRAWSSEVKAIGAFVWCLLAALLLLVAGDRLHAAALDATSLVGTFLTIFVLAIGLYRWYFQPSGIAARIEGVTG